MTPTEQDKELRNSIEWEYHFITGEEDELSSQAKKSLNRVMQLITADRKRVANADREVLKDLVVRAAPDGTQDDGDFVGFYVLPTGPVHRAIAYFQGKGGIETLGDASVISRYQAHLKRVALEARLDEIEESGKALSEAYKESRIPQLQSELEESYDAT